MSKVGNPKSSHAKAPGPVGRPFLGSLLEVRDDRLTFVVELARQFGDVARFRMGPKIMHLINDPSHAKHVLQENSKNYNKGLGLEHAKPLLGEGLLTSEGDLWARQRHLVEPALRNPCLARYAAVVREETMTMIEQWQHWCETQRPVDVMVEVPRLTLRILFLTLFGTDMQTPSRAITESFNIAMEEASRRIVEPFTPPIWIPTRRNVAFKRALSALDEIVYGIIDARIENENESTSSQHDDVLSVLVRAMNDNRMNREQVRDEIVTILLAGHETTALTIVWSWYLMCRHPEIEEKLRSEIHESLGDRPPLFRDLTKLDYTRKVIKESLRLYPPVWLIPRTSVAADTIGGYYIPAGSAVLISPYCMHRNKAFWDRPDSFDPEHFSDRAISRDRYAYLPFGAGPRHCLGSGFGLMEAQIVIVMVAQSFRLRLVPDTDGSPKPLLTLRPPSSLRFTIEASEHF